VSRLIICSSKVVIDIDSFGWAGSKRFPKIFDKFWKSTNLLMI